MSTQDKNINQIQKIADDNSNYLKLAFLAAIIQLSKNISNEDLDIAIANNSIDGMLRAINPDQLDDLLHGIGMDKKNFIFLDESMTIFHIAAAVAFQHLSTDLQMKWHYNPINERAVNTLISDSSRIALELTESTKATVSMLLNPSVVYTSDLNARIRDIKQTLGLTQNQARAVLNFRDQLENQKNLGFTSPQNRLMSDEDRIILTGHMKNGTLTQSGIDNMVNRYYESLLNKRAEEIALGATMNAINAGMNEMWLQGMNQGVLDIRDRKFWVTAGDKKVRPTHVVIPGMNLGGVAINSMFLTPTGMVPYPMWGMGDYINCRCTVVLQRI